MAFDHLVRQHRYQRRSCALWHQPQLGRIAGLIALGIQGDLQLVRRGRGIGGGVPPRIEIQGCLNVGAIQSFNHQFITAPIRGRGQQKRCFLQQGFARGDAFATGAAFPVPIAIKLIPVITSLDPVQAPFHPHRHRPLVRRQGYQLKPRLCALGNHTIEQGLDAQNRTRGAYRQIHCALNRATRSICQPGRQCGLKGHAGGLNHRELYGYAGCATGIGIVTTKIVALAVARRIKAAKVISRPLFQGTDRAQAQIAINAQIRPWCAKEIARRNIKLSKFTRPQITGIGNALVKINPLWHEVFDQNLTAGQGWRFDIALDL